MKRFITIAILLIVIALLVLGLLINQRQIHHLEKELKILGNMGKSDSRKIAKLNRVIKGKTTEDDLVEDFIDAEIHAAVEEFHEERRKEKELYEKWGDMVNCDHCTSKWGTFRAIAVANERAAELEAEGLEIWNIEIRSYAIIRYGDNGNHSTGYEKVNMANDTFACLNCEEYYKEKE